MLLAIFAFALLALIIGLWQAVEFLVWLALLGIGLGIIFAIADWVRGRA